jgi:stalled ribosome alternative rescue factor ArfA
MYQALIPITLKGNIMPRKKRRLKASKMNTTLPAPKVRNPAAHMLESPLFKPKTIENKKYKAINRRKGKHNAKLYGDYHFRALTPAA